MVSIDVCRRRSLVSCSCCEEDDWNSPNSTNIKKKHEKPSFTLTRFAGKFGPPMAEWCLARIIAHERNFDASAADQAQGLWAASKQVTTTYRYLSDLTVTILGGCGDIGSTICRAAQGLGMHVVAFNKTTRTDEAQSATASSSSAATHAKGWHEVTQDLEYALKQADYLVDVLPSTHETRDNRWASVKGLDLEKPAPSRRDWISCFWTRLRCKKNPADGQIDFLPDWMGAFAKAVESCALAKSQPQRRRGQQVARFDQCWTWRRAFRTRARCGPRGGILDVFCQEALPASSPLWTMPNVVVSPHVSGVTRAQDVPALFLAQYRRYAEGQPLQYVVDWEKGY